MEKTIVCLANSRKISGRCIAGKEINAPNSWVRPVSSREHEEISEEERRYENGQKSQVLDIIRIQFIEYKENTFQTENILIDSGYYWEKTGEFNHADLDLLLDNPESLWRNHNSSYNGIRDRISEANTAGISNSLYLIKTCVTINVATEGTDFGNPRRKVRCTFTYNSWQYKLPVTDPKIEEEYLGYEDGDYPIGMKYLCVSLGLCFSHDAQNERYAYMFAAGVI